MPAPEIVECRIIHRTTQFGDNSRAIIRRDGLYAYTEILMTDEHGRHYCSHTWDEIPDNAFSREAQKTEFRKRWDRAERQKP